MENKNNLLICNLFFILLNENMFLKKDMQIEGKLSFVCIVKKLQKVRVIHGMK